MKYIIEETLERIYNNTLMRSTGPTIPMAAIESNLNLAVVVSIRCYLKT